MTTALPLPPPLNGWHLLQQALALFVEVEPDELATQHIVKVRLVDEDDNPAYLAYGPNFQGDLPEPGRVEIQSELVVQEIPGIPDNVHRTISFVADFNVGTLWIPAVQRRYIWKINVGDCSEEIGFWVEEQADSYTVERVDVGLSEPKL